MSDIEIIFGSNAPTVTREINAAEQATVAAARATTALDKAVASVTQHMSAEARGLKAAASAAREYAKELRATQNLLTGAPTGSRGAATPFGDMGKSGAIRTNIQRALASSNRDIRAVMEKAGEEGGGGFGAGIRRALERSLNRGGFLGAKDSPIASMFGGGAGGAGAAATIGIGAAYLAVSKTIEAINVGFAAHLATLTRVAEAAGRYRDNLREAAEANRAAGVAAGQAHGSAILSVTANGGQAALDVVRANARKAGTDENDAAAAYQTLYSRFGGDQNAITRGLEIGADVAKVTGKGLNDTVATLGKQELTNKLTARDRLTALAEGHITVQRGDYNRAAANVAASPDAVHVQSIRGSLASADVNADRNLGAGTVGAMDAAAAAADPGQKMLLDRFNAEERQIKVLQDISDSMGFMTKLWDGIKNGSDSIRVRLAHDEQAHAIEGGFTSDANGAQPVH